MGSLRRLFSIRQSSVQSLGTALWIAAHPEEPALKKGRKPKDKRLDDYLHTNMWHLQWVQMFLGLQSGEITKRGICLFLCILSVFRLTSVLNTFISFISQKWRPPLRIEVWKQQNKLTLSGLLCLNRQCCLERQKRRRSRMDDCTVTSSGNWLMDDLSTCRFLIAYTVHVCQP